MAEAEAAEAAPTDGDREVEDVSDDEQRPDVWPVTLTVANDPGYLPLLEHAVRDSAGIATAGTCLRGSMKSSRRPRTRELHP